MARAFWFIQQSFSYEKLPYHSLAFVLQTIRDIKEGKYQASATSHHPDSSRMTNKTQQNTPEEHLSQPGSQGH